MNKKVVLIGVLILIIQVFFSLNAGITGNVISVSSGEFSLFLIVQLILSCTLILFGLFSKDLIQTRLEEMESKNPSSEETRNKKSGFLRRIREKLYFGLRKVKQVDGVRPLKRTKS